MTMIQPDLPDWYDARRQKINAYFSMRAKGEPTPPSTAPSGRYSLQITLYSTGTKTWNYRLGQVFDAIGGQLVASVRRNYSSFPFAWVEAFGTTLLICGEDYQGQTVLDCSTGEVVHHVGDGAEKGIGFCWTSIDPNPHDQTLLLVAGCHWAAPYEARLYRLGRDGGLTRLESPDYMEIDGDWSWKDGGRSLEVKHEDWAGVDPDDDDAEPRVVTEIWDVSEVFGLAESRFAV